MQFTLDLPLLVAVSVLYLPPVAALLALASSADVREFRGEVGVWHAIYNRCQVALAVFMASSGYHVFAQHLSEWPDAILGTAFATGIFVVANGLFVSTYVVSRDEGSFGHVLRRLHVGRPSEFLVTYFAYGILAYALSRLFLEIGVWSIPLFLAPIVVAYAALVRAERVKALAERLKKRERLLEMLTGRVEDERKDERLRIASGLHDDVLQSLIRISQLGSFLRGTAPTGSQADKDAAELATLAGATIDTLRAVVGDLQHSPIGRGGLLATLRTLVDDLQFQSRVSIDFESAADLSVPGGRQLILYQVARESLTNALRHAEPASVRVKLRSHSQRVILTVEDDGHGFDPSGVDESAHFGIGLMRERLRLAGGSLRISSRQGGTRVEATIPATEG
jgi:signal transduction histidine kinase